MQLSEVKELLKAEVLCCQERLSKEVDEACGCDLMSDVLAFAKAHTLLLTGLINLQVIRTAEMLDIKSIIFVRGKAPTPDMIAYATERNMLLLSTELPLYTACGKLYEAGLQGKEEA